MTKGGAARYSSDMTPRQTLPLFTLCALLLVACTSGLVALEAGASGHTVNSPADTTTPLPTIDVPPTPTAEAAPGLGQVTPSLPSPTPYPDDERFLIGESVEGRPIWAWRLGDGTQRIVLVGGIHGSYEANSARLAELLANHFRLHRADVLPGIQLVIIPAANPDGLAYQGDDPDDLRGRFNANGVDLNRNWGCGWAEEATLRDIPVDPGPRPFSEPETRALRAYFLAEPPEAVIFYHSQLGAVFMGACGAEHPAATWMGDLLEDATGYPHRNFTYYEVTGDATNWLAERGIAAAVVELSTRTDPEFTRNLAGVQALQCYIALAKGPDDGPNESFEQAIGRLCR